MINWNPQSFHFNSLWQIEIQTGLISIHFEKLKSQKFWFQFRMTNWNEIYFKSISTCDHQHESAFIFLLSAFKCFHFVINPGRFDVSSCCIPLHFISSCDATHGFQILAMFPNQPRLDSSELRTWTDSNGEKSLWHVRVHRSGWETWYLWYNFSMFLFAYWFLKICQFCIVFLLFCDMVLFMSWGRQPWTSSSRMTGTCSYLHLLEGWYVCTTSWQEWPHQMIKSWHPRFVGCHQRSVTLQLNALWTRAHDR